MASKRILITGANRGIGFSIVQALATRFPSNTYILAARSAASIEPAIASLRAAGVKARIEGIELDVRSDASISDAVSQVASRFGGLEVLVNNAGVAEVVAGEAPLPKQREAWARVLDTNVTSVCNVTQALLPMLKTAISPPLVINVSSGRASLTRSVEGAMPPTASVQYSVSKIALNGLTIEFSKSHPDVKFYAVNPGHCKTQFNGFKGQRDPLEGAGVVVGIVEGDGKVEPGFWETIGDSPQLSRVPW